jgi:hypothetical protein
MLLEHTSSVAGGGAPRPRQWYRAAATPLPAEPGRLVCNALVNVARHARGCRTAGDDRIETRAYAVKRLLWRWGHAHRSGRYACSIAQLVTGLAPIMGWGRAPLGRTKREEWVCAHRKSVQRWLDDLQTAGLLSYAGELDNRGELWRTVIELRAAPAVPLEEMRTARRRSAAYKTRARRRRRQLRRSRQRTIEAIRTDARGQVPQRRTRVALARQRTRAITRLRSRDACVSDASKDWTHLFEAPPSSENTTSASDLPSAPKKTSNADNTTDTGLECNWSPRFAGRNGRASACDQDLALPEFSASNGNSSSREQTADSGDDLGLRIAARVAERERQRTAALELAAVGARKRVLEVLGGAAGRGWPLWRLREAWIAFAHGLQTEVGDGRSGVELIAESGVAAAGVGPAGLHPALTAAIGVYEANAAYRPPGWPSTGAGAVCALAPTTTSLAHAAAQLQILASNMAARSLRDQAERPDRQRRRAQRRATERNTTALAGRFTFRQSMTDELPRWLSDEQLVERVRDRLLGAGYDPGVYTLQRALWLLGWDRKPRNRELQWQVLDGAAARAYRYLEELRVGRWTLPAVVREALGPDRLTP